MEDTQARLKDWADKCIKAYDNWKGREKEPQAREALQESMHELRKVLSRLEIEVAVSERSQTAQRNIPIPPHRASMKRHEQSPGNEFEDDGGAEDDSSAPPPGQGFSGPPRRRMQRRMTES